MFAFTHLRKEGVTFEYVWPDGSKLEVTKDGFKASDKDGHHVVTAIKNNAG